MTSFSGHGKYRIHWRGDILHLEFHDSWNVEAVEAFIAEVKAVIAARGDRPWGRLADMRHWKGSTPEATRIYSDFTACYAMAGAVAHAQIYPSKLMQNVADPVNRRVALCGPVRQFSTPDEALAWLHDFGLATEDTP